MNTTVSQQIKCQLLNNYTDFLIIVCLSRSLPFVLLIL